MHPKRDGPIGSEVVLVMIGIVEVPLLQLQPMIGLNLTITIFRYLRSVYQYIR